MKSELPIRYVYNEGQYHIFDTEFYRTLPGVSEEAYDAKTGRPTVPLPDPLSVIMFVGTAVLSSSVLATAIKSWLEYKKTKITISYKEGNEERTISYEGPGIKDSVEAIRTQLEMLHPGENKNPLLIKATRLPEEAEESHDGNQ
jgi:hypothetical protein